MRETFAFFPFDNTKDQEEWPLLELTDATVYKRAGPAELEDLLDVQDRGPFRIEGNLSPIPDELGSIIRTKNPAKLYDEPLVVSQVMMYSIEQFEDGNVKIWALGKCGWYSIIPSEKYKSTFKTMVEKGKLWLFLQDKYCDQYSGRGSNIKGAVEDLYLEYSRLEPGVLSMPAVAQLFEKHYRYLLFEMCGVRADTDMWPRTPLYRYLASKHGAELKSIRRSMACSNDEIEIPVPSEREVSIVSSPPAPLAREPSPSSKRPRVHNRSTSYVIFKLFCSYVEARNLTPEKITKDLIVQFFYESFAFESLQHATVNAHARAEEFLSLMECPPPAMLYAWTETPAYEELGFVRTSENDASIRQEKLVPRPKKKGNSNGDNGDNGENIGEPSGASATISVRSTKHPGPAKGKSPGRVPVRLQASSSSKSIGDNDNNPVPEDNPAAVAVNQKRALEGFLSPQKAAKRPRTRTTSTTESSARSSTLSSSPSLQPGSSKVPFSGTLAQATRANRPGGHWQCEISGCNLSILDPDLPENLQLIEKHYIDHAKIIKQAIDTIGGGYLSASSKPLHHVDNLLAKIERMAETWAITKPAPLTPLELGFPGSKSSSAAPRTSGAQ